MQRSLGSFCDGKTKKSGTGASTSIRAMDGVPPSFWPPPTESTLEGHRRVLADEPAAHGRPGGQADSVYSQLKTEVDGHLFTSGSGTPVKAMLADGLVDQLHLFVYPLTRGSGPRLFTPDASPLGLKLASAESFEHGMIYLNYILER